MVGLTNVSIVNAEGKVENVIVTMDKFAFPTNKTVIEMREFYECC